MTYPHSVLYHGPSKNGICTCAEKEYGIVWYFFGHINMYTQLKVFRRVYRNANSVTFRRKREEL